MLQGKTVILGVTGGIAAYKAAAVASKLTQAGASTHVVMTASATKFIAPLTFQAITRHRVIVDTFDEEDAAVISHIDLADRADAVVVAPATANSLAKMALGLGDDMLSTTLLAVRAPVLVAPAMNVHMYANPIVQSHMEALRSRGVRFVEPGEGFLACGYTGKGRLAEPEEIVDKLSALFEERRDMSGLRVLVTAGATVERIDPVRYLTNDSSGKMGFAVAEAFRDRGASVTLVAGRADATPPQGVTLIRVQSAQDMYEAVIAASDEMDVIVKAAAVADYRPASIAEQKLKKSDGSLELTLTLERTPDILAELGRRRRPEQVLIGFAAETHDVERYAMGKAASKGCDYIVANDVSQPGVGFGFDTNAVSIYTAEGLAESVPLSPKRVVAERIVELARRTRVARAAGRETSR
ncbi:bifunctional phosphopantothenoylcysteine decarboxylase/phosphopantothenate--cysteine ligase CoaBC [Paenibacillus sp. TRM 82003]|nr:bifunctional phosphopantothenoylcysteine decarboxylase/phosphopantothenate--cysteine ligase CoaBC [Paenibacillus sp. TRM 82003]